MPVERGCVLPAREVPAQRTEQWLPPQLQPPPLGSPSPLPWHRLPCRSDLPAGRRLARGGASSPDARHRRR
eukprot:2250781-Rhodomonas_salina.1